MRFTFDRGVRQSCKERWLTKTHPQRTQERGKNIHRDSLCFGRFSIFDAGRKMTEQLIAVFLSNVWEDQTK